MPQAESLVISLKHTLKEMGVTYSDLAAGIGLSEASIKRLFSEQSFSLKRLDQICDWLGIEFSDLINHAEKKLVYISALTMEQERTLADDPKLLLTAILITNHWLFDEILGFFSFDKPELISKLVTLDRLQMIQLLPDNRVKLLTSRNFTWRKHGPVQQFFFQHVQSEFFRSRFNRPEDTMHFMVGMLSEESRKKLDTILARAAREFEELSRRDARLPLEARSGTSVVLAAKPWDLPVFDQFKRLED